MQRSPTRCEERFRAAAPRPLFEQVWRYLDGVYRTQHAQVFTEFNQEPAFTLLPHQRRARIESDLPRLMFELGLHTTVEKFPNTTDTFVLIHLPGDVKLIVCYVRDKTKAVRYALARTTLTHENNMPYLLPPTHQPTVLTPQTLFSILAHSPDEKDIGRFSGAQFLFPSPDPMVALGQLDLLGEMERVQQEDAAAAATVKRKVNIKLKKGGQAS